MTASSALAPASRRLLALATWLLAGAAWYWPTRRAGWVTDILGLLPRLTDEAGLAGAWTGYGSPVFHPLTLGAHYLLYRYAGAQSLAYFAVWVGLHALCAWLLAEGLSAAMRDYRLPRARAAGVLAGAAFLLHPYVAEAVVWRATLNYLLCAPLLLLACGAGYGYAKTGRRMLLVGVASATALALLSFDLAWAAPLLVAVGAAAAGGPRIAAPTRRRVAVIATVSLAVFVAYLVAKAAVIGTAVGHYGAGVHLRFDLATILPNVWRALLKPALLTRELPYPLKAGYHDLIARWWVYAPLTLAGLALLAAWWRRLRIRSARWRLAGWVGLGTLVAIAPTANLYAYWLQLGEGDRYGYLPTLGVVAVLALGWSAIPWRAVRSALAVVALATLALVGRENLAAWAEAEYAQRRLVATWPVADDAPVVVLAAADNYRGTYLFRDGNVPYHGVDFSLRYLGDHAPADTVENLVGYNRLSLDDAVEARVNELGEVELAFAQFGNWFWGGGIGLSDYERPGFRVTAADPVRICFTEPLAPGTALLYPTGLTWSRLDPAGLRTCREVDAARAAQ